MSRLNYELVGGTKFIGALAGDIKIDTLPTRTLTLAQAVSRAAKIGDLVFNQPFYTFSRQLDDAPHITAEVNTTYLPIRGLYMLDQVYLRDEDDDYLFVRDDKSSIFMSTPTAEIEIPIALGQKMLDARELIANAAELLINGSLDL